MAETHRGQPNLSTPHPNVPHPTVTVPSPTAEEAAAIMAAIEACWPRPSTIGPIVEPRNTAWRFSSRNWARPLPVRRLRPWR